MLLLTATAFGQGARANDYNSTIEGELVWTGFICARDRLDPDGGCGCGRGFSGLNSHRAGTTALIRDLPLTRDDVSDALTGYLESAGYGTPTAPDLIDLVEDLVAPGRHWPVGTLVERRLDLLYRRGHVSASR